MAIIGCFNMPDAYEECTQCELSEYSRGRQTFRVYDYCGDFNGGVSEDLMKQVNYELNEFVKKHGYCRNACVECFFSKAGKELERLKES